MIFIFTWPKGLFSRRIIPLHPKISMHILQIVLYAVLRVLTRRICSTIQSFFSWWSFPLILMTLMFDTGMVLLGEIWCWSLLGFKGLHEKGFFSLQGRMWKIYTRLVLITVWIKNFYSDYNKVRVLVNFSQVWNFFKSYLDTVFFSEIRSRFSDLELVLILAGEGVFSLLICLFVRFFFYFFFALYHYDQ